jgi:hypothetical protein
MLRRHPTESNDRGRSSMELAVTEPISALPPVAL